MIQALSCSCRRFLIIVGLTIVTVSYTLLGAYIFQAVDGRRSVSPKDKGHSLLLQVERSKNETISYIVETMIYDSRNGILTPELIRTSVVDSIDDFTTKIIEAYRTKKIFTNNDQPISFQQSLSFSLSLLTTIGSGQAETVLKTTTSKAIVFPYALIGIPLMLVWLLMLGSTLTHLIIIIHNRICCFLCRRHSSSVSESDDDYGNTGCCVTSDHDNICVPFFVILTMVLLWSILGTVALVQWESWQYLDASLYVFKTLMTIGFSSQEPTMADGDGIVKFVLYVFYIWFGLVLVAASLRIIFMIIDRFFRSKRKGSSSDNVSY